SHCATECSAPFLLLYDGPIHSSESRCGGGYNCTTAVRRRRRLPSGRRKDDSAPSRLSLDGALGSFPLGSILVCGRSVPGSVGEHTDCHSCLLERARILHLCMGVRHSSHRTP